MEIITIYPRGFGSNTYVITEDGMNAVVIDPGQVRVESELLKRGLKASVVLLTHCHFDHVNGVMPLQESGAKVYCSDVERPLVDTEVNMYEDFGIQRIPYRVDGAFSDNEEKMFCGLKVKMLLTPGHTAGSCCYLITAKDGTMSLFTGDTLFLGSMGRTDFPSGNAEQMRASLRRLAALEGDYPVYPGHSDATTLQHERDTNPFMRDA